MDQEIEIDRAIDFARNRYIVVGLIGRERVLWRHENIKMPGYLVTSARVKDGAVYRHSAYFPEEESYHDAQMAYLKVFGREGVSWTNARHLVISREALKGK